jgi:hypothetical protein
VTEHEALETGEVHQLPEDTREICDEGLEASLEFALGLLNPRFLETGHIGDEAVHVEDSGEGFRVDVAETQHL